MALPAFGFLEMGDGAPPWKVGINELACDEIRGKIHPEITGLPVRVGDF